ncbi:Signal transducer regulating beta-lactamase production, contains metallopeptidase domain [Chitinophaga rupis]|uniref:Signal transducer regulating beta-lactamase production, contains metallopeptidase domain n=1 Tax=Chitinophaga rupis TaxID=573321 RepID=A0A1H7XP28_9BACT|nr:M56 family metallopeptidase [Chitinophaga rupis]SEM35491.1 Signal transducer regulating beta-lactamase production, contains metallopeptidase domain [Chitinophaga rupis]
MFLPYTTDLVTALGWAILHSTWQALLIFGCLRIVLKLWPTATASTKYNLSFISLAGIFGWFVVTLFQQLDAVTQVHAIANPAAAASPILLNIPVVYQNQQELTWAFPNLEFCFPILVALYMAGVGVMCIKLFADLAQLQQIRKQQGLPADTAWEQYLRKLSKQLQIPRKVKLLVSQHIQVPVMMGFLKPVILVPIAMFNNLSAEQLEAILLHELAHVKRNDYILNIFQSIVETTLFFNPFVWWISKYIRLEREHCCDDMVIAHTVQPLHYAKALVALEEYRFTTNPMAMAAADNKQHLFYRIKRIMEMKTSHLNYSQKLMAVLIIAVGLTAIAWITPSARQDNKAATTAGKPLMAAVHTTTPANQDTVPAKSGTPVPAPTPTSTYDRDSKADTSGNSAGHTDFDYDSDKDMKDAKEKMDAAQEQMIIAQKAMQQAMKNIDWKKINEETAKAMKNVDWNQINKNVNEAMKNVDWKKINAEINASIKESQQSWDPEVINQSVQLGLQSAKEAMASINLEEIIKNSMQEAQEGMKRSFSPEEKESMRKEIAAARKEARQAQEEALKEVRKNAREATKKAREQMDYARADARRSETTARQQAEQARRQAEVARRKAEVTHARYNELVKKMAADNLLDPNKAYSIEKKNGQLYINGTQQSSAVMDKYRSYLEEGNTITLKGEKDNLNINIQD